MPARIRKSVDIFNHRKHFHGPCVVHPAFFTPLRSLDRPIGSGARHRRDANPQG